MTTSPADTLPAFLQAEQEMAPEHIPLQVLLLTMELARVRQQLAQLSNGLKALALAVEAPSGDLTSFGGSL